MRENGCDSTLPGSTRCSLILQIKTHATTTNTMRNVEYITNGFGGPGPIPSTSTGLVGANYPRGRDKFLLANDIADTIRSAGFEPFLKPVVDTLEARGTAGIDQAINFFSRYDQSLQALSQMITQNNQTFGGRRGKEYVYEAVRRVFNAISSQVGTNPLITAMTKSILSQINQSQAQEYKFILAYTGEAYTQALRKLRSAL